MFELTGLSSADSMFQPVIIGITNALFTILGLIIIDKVGRKKLLITGIDIRSFPWSCFFIFLHNDDSAGYCCMEILS